VIYLPFKVILQALKYFRNSNLSERALIEQSPLFAENKKRDFLGMIYEALFMIRRTLTILVLMFIIEYPIF
jgi:hypothetical protein